VFDISKIIEDPIGILAALFHDCIYLTVDGGLTAVQSELIKNENITLEDEQLSISFEKKVTSHGRLSILGNTDSVQSVDNIESLARSKARKKQLYMVQSVFGLPQEDNVHVPVGINEFYSALVAVRFLSEHLRNEDLVKIICCIEATIPFRNSPLSSSAMEKLYGNMVATRNSFKLKLSDKELVEAVQLATTLANEDVGNFGSSDRLYFLDNTWSLLPELNLKLRAQFLYTAFEFQEAMYKMSGFFGFLKPNVVFASYKGVPNQQELAELISNCTTNLHIGKKYVGAKFLSASFLAAVAELTGGDSPLSMFMGDLPDRNKQGYTLEAEIISRQEISDGPPEGFCDPVVYDILHNGRRGDVLFDIKRSPLAAYLYCMIGQKGLDDMLKNHTLYPMNEETAYNLLRNLPLSAVTYLIDSMADLTVSRIRELKALVKKLRLTDQIPEEEEEMGSDEEGKAITGSELEFKKSSLGEEEATLSDEEGNTTPVPEEDGWDMEETSSNFF